MYEELKSISVQRKAAAVQLAGGGKDKRAERRSKRDATTATVRYTIISLYIEIDIGIDSSSNDRCIDMYDQITASPVAGRTHVRDGEVNAMQRRLRCALQFCDFI